MDIKKEYRASVKAFLRTLEPGYFKASGLLAAEKLVTEAAWRNADRVLLFISINLEIDTSPLLGRAFSQGKEVYAPRVEGGDLQFYRIMDEAFPCDENAFGCREPRGGARLQKADDAVLVITPGLAFDRNGGRLGRGKGCYDRFFARLGREQAAFFAVGFCLKEQIVEGLPLDDGDRPVDAIASSDGVFNMAASPK